MRCAGFILHQIQSSMISDFDLALTREQEQRYRAENEWRNTRFLWPPKKNAIVDKNLEELREHLDELKEDQKASQPEYDDDFEEFMHCMYQKYSRVIGAEGEWNKMLQKRSQEALEREQAEIEEYQAQKKAEKKEREVRERDKLQEEAIKDIRRLFGDNDGEKIESDDEENMGPEIRAWLDQLPKDRD